MGLLGKKTATATAGDGGSASPTGGNISGGGMMGSMLRQMIDSGQIKGPKPISATEKLHQHLNVQMVVQLEVKQKARFARRIICQIKTESQQ